MNGCENVNLLFESGSLNSRCETVPSLYGNSVTSKYFLNLNKLDYTIYQLNRDWGIYICQYDKNYNMVSRKYIGAVELGNFESSINPNLYTKISYQPAAFKDLSAYQCNVGIGSMSNELAFGSVNFMDTLGVIIPFIVLMIGFALAFTLLKKLIFKSNNGKI